MAQRYADCAMMTKSSVPHRTRRRDRDVDPAVAAGLVRGRHDGSHARMTGRANLKHALVPRSYDHLAEALMRFGRPPVVLAGLSAPGKAYHFS